MTVSELISANGYRAISLPEPDREVCGAYCGDLLSWVMGRASAGNAWMTIMTNTNVIAVASLIDVSVVIICDGCVPDDNFIETARDRSVNVVVSNSPEYEVCLEISRVLG